jgi:hypothetical protein
MAVGRAPAIGSFVNVREFMRAARDERLECRRHDVYSCRVTVAAAPDYHDTIAAALDAFKLPPRRAWWELTVVICESPELFGAARAEYERRAAGASRHATGTRFVRVPGGLIARQDIPTSVRLGHDSDHCLIVGSIATRTACFLFEPRSQRANHTFIRACLITLLCQSRPYHCVHGGAIAFEGKGILLIGPRQCGKTTTLLRLHLAGCRVLSDNLSFVHDGRIVPFFLMHDPMLNLGPDAYASVAAQLNDRSQRSAWNADGRRLVDMRPVIPAGSDRRVPLNGIVFPRLSSAFNATRLDAVTAMRRYEREIVVPELELFARKFRRGWLFRWKSRRYWRKQLRDVPLFEVSLDKADIDGSIEKLRRLLASIDGGAARVEDVDDVPRLID